MDAGQDIKDAIEFCREAQQNLKDTLSFRSQTLFEMLVQELERDLERQTSRKDERDDH